MLPRAHRMTRSADFGSTVRDGVRARSGSVVVHHLGSAVDGDPSSARFGLVVSRAVGPSVVRHRVARRLRAQLAIRVSAVPAGSRTVIRALPSSARSSSAVLAADLDRALDKLSRAAVAR